MRKCPSSFYKAKWEEQYRSHRHLCTLNTRLLKSNFHVEKIPDDRGMLLFLHHARFCPLKKTPNHTVDIAVSTGRLGKNHKNRECSIFRTHPRLLRCSEIISDTRKLKKNYCCGCRGSIYKRSLIFAWSRPWPDFPDTYLSTMTDDWGNREIPDLPDI